MVQAIRIRTGIIPAAILLIGIVLLASLPMNHKRELAIQAAIKEKHNGGPSAPSEAVASPG